MNELVLQSPVVLTDDIFEMYGGDLTMAPTGTRQAAYAIAESMAQQMAHCFLSPTIVTGTFQLPIDGRVMLDYLALREIKSVSFVAYDSSCDEVLTSGCYEVISYPQSVVRVKPTGTCAKCGGTAGKNTSVRIVYESGIGGAAGYPNILLGLSIAAKKVLEQIVDPDLALGGPGDPEVKSFGDTGLSMSYGSTIPSTFGRSPEMQLATRLIKYAMPRRTVLKAR